MPYHVRLRPRPARLVLRRQPRPVVKLAINYSPFSTPDQRLSIAVRAIQRCYGQRIVVWRKAQILSKPGVNRLM